MDDDRILYGHTYRPAYGHSYDQHDHVDYIIGLAPAGMNREAILLLFSVVIAPLILCTVVGIGLTAAALYELIERNFADKTRSAGKKYDRGNHSPVDPLRKTLDK